MKYTMRQIKESLPNEKKKDDSLLALYVSRPLSYPLTYILINAGLSAWDASVLSIFTAVLGCVAFWFNSSVMRWGGFFLIFMWSILDCVDGNIARVKKTSSQMGSFMDAESGYVISALIYFSFGIAAYHTEGILPITKHKEWLLFFGAIASISDILARLIHQRFTVSCLESHRQNISNTSNRFGKIRKKISAEIGIAGFVVIAPVLGEIFEIYDLIALVYFLYCGFSLLVVLIVYSISAKKV